MIETGKYDSIEKRGSLNILFILEMDFHTTAAFKRRGKSKYIFYFMFIYLYVLVCIVLIYLIHM